MLSRNLSLLLCAFVIGTSSLAQASEVLGFRAWKAQRIEDAKTVFERNQSEASVDQNAPKEKPVQIRVGTAMMRVQKGNPAESRVKQAQNNLELATELTINDYFVLYLSQLNGPDSIREAAKKMTPDEVTELMMAYKKRLEGGRAEIGLVPGPTSTPSRL